MTTLIRIAGPVALIALATAPAASGQVPGSGGVSALQIQQGGVSVGVDPQQGVTLGVDAGETGGATVGAGPQGAQLNLKQGVAKLPGSSGGSSDSPSSQPETSSPVTTPVTDPSARERESGSGAATISVLGEDQAPSGASRQGRDSSGSGSGDRRVGARPVAEKDRPGVAPVLDLIEKIPAAVWVALGALALIALALWSMWVRGRRRLERNAWMDSESPEMNIIAFETLLAQEWARSDRYRRPLGLLLLELAEPISGDGSRPLTGKYRSQAQEAITTQAREADTVAQLSPSRFAVICPEASQGSVETLARRLEHSLETVRVHARVGMASRAESDRGPADLVSRAAVGIDEQPTWVNPVIVPPAAQLDDAPAVAA